MKFLDQLEQKARAQREKEDRAALEAEERRAFFQEVVDPVMRELFDNLKRLCEHLNYLTERAEIAYPTPGYGKVTGTLGNNLRALFGSDTESRKINLVGSVDVPTQRELQVGGERDIRRFRDFLTECSLRGNEKVRQDNRGRPLSAVFRLEGQITLRGEIVATVDRPELVMTFVNYYQFGQQRKVFQPEELNEETMDSLARFIAGMDPNFMKEILSEDARRELSARLQAERKAKEIKERAKDAKHRVQKKEEARKAAEEARKRQEREALARKLSSRFKSRLDKTKRRIEPK